MNIVNTLIKTSTMKKILTLLLFVAIARQFSFAQNIKVYNGPFNEGASFNGQYYDNEDKGTATYQYYENEKNERIYDGNFTYLNKKPYDPAYGSITSVIGQFKENKKSGMWEYKITSLGLHDKIESIKVVKGKYINGKLDGLWTFKNTENGTNKILGESVVTFKSGVLVGKYECNIGYSVKGNFDDKGNRIGEWIISYNNNADKIEIKRKYENDILVSTLKRNLANGNILVEKGEYDYSYDFYKLGDDRVLDFWLQPSGWIASDVNPIFRWIIRGSDFITLRNNTSSYNAPSKEDLETEKRLQLESDYKLYISNADSAFSKKDYRYAMKQYMSAYSINKTDYVLEQTFKIKQLFDNIIIEADKKYLSGDYTTAITIYESALKVKEDARTITQISNSKVYISIDSLLRLNNYDLAISRCKLLNNYDFSKLLSNVKDKAYNYHFQKSDSLVKAKKYSLAVKEPTLSLNYSSNYTQVKEIKEQIEYINTIVKYENIADENDEKINTDSEFVNEKQNVYENYKEVYAGFKNETDLYKYSYNIKYLTQIQDNILKNIKGNKTKSLERNLKGAKDISEKASLLISFNYE